MINRRDEKSAEFRRFLSNQIAELDVECWTPHYNLLILQDDLQSWQLIKNQLPGVTAADDDRQSDRENDPNSAASKRASPKRPLHPGWGAPAEIFSDFENSGKRENNLGRVGVGGKAASLVPDPANGGHHDHHFALTDDLQVSGDNGVGVSDELMARAHQQVRKMLAAQAEKLEAEVKAILAGGEDPADWQIIHFFQTGEKRLVRRTNPRETPSEGTIGIVQVVVT